jgi:signal transduction histidine kinase/ligand-binding sensor domain-containing protein
VKTRHSITLLLLLSCLAVSPLHAVDPDRRISQYAHTTWTVRDGVLTANPYAVTQTKDGYIWIGSQSGLVRFDGVRFVPWTAPGGTQLPSPDISALLGARDGSLWIGTRDGLSHWTGQKLINFPEARNMVESIVEDRYGTIWITHAEGASPLCHVTDDKIRCYGAAEGVPDFGGPSHMDQDSLGNLWIGGSAAIVRWTPGSSATYRPRMLQSYAGLSAVDGLVIDDQNSIWAGMSVPGPEGGLQHLVRGEWKPFITSELDGRTLEIQGLFMDSHRALWIGTRKQGVYRIVGQRVDHYQSTDGLSGDFVDEFYEDREGNIWASTSKGLDKFSDLQVVTYSASDGIGAEEIHSVISARDGTLWIGEAGALQALRNGNMSSIKTGSGLPGAFVTSLFEDHKGRLWIGIDKGLTIYENGRFRPVSRPDGSASGVVTGITEDANNDVWIETTGSGRALLRIHDDKIAEVFPPSMMPQGRKVAGDPTGGIWIGTKSGDLIHYRNGHSESIPFKQDIGMRDATSYVEQIMTEPDGSVLAATGFGLVAWRQGQKQTLTVQNGLPCNRLFGMVYDNAGALWLSTECGLVEIANAELQKWWLQPDSHLNVRLIDQLSGVQPGWAPFETAAKTPDGHLWFVNSYQLQTLDPQHLYQNLIRPPVSVEGMTADRKLYGPTQDVALPPLTRELQIDYTALSFVVPKKVRFRYKLEGHDVDWQDAGTRRQAFYNDLRPGTFTFRVIACNNDGVWNEAGASLKFIVAPAWFQTNWFRALCALLLFLLLAAIYQIRVRSIAKAISARFDERLDERTRMALELHDTFLQTVQGSKMVADDALDPDADQVRMRHALERLSVWLGQAVTEGRAALHALRVSTTERNHLAEFLDRTAKEYSQRSSISVALTVIGDARDLHPIVRDEIARIAEEAIRNTCLHSKASQLSVELRYGRELVLSLKDNGVGIDPEVMGAGKPGHFGLQGMKERSARIRARITITSTLNAGTEIVLNVPGDVIYRREKRSPFSSLRILNLWPRPSSGQKPKAGGPSDSE